MNENFVTRTIYRLINFLLMFLIAPEGAAATARMTKAIEEAEKVLERQQQISKAIGDTGSADDCFRVKWLLLAVKVELKREGKARITLPPLRRVWPVEEKR